MRRDRETLHIERKPATIYLKHSSEMDKIMKIPSIESHICDAIEHIEKKSKKRTDLEQICKFVVNKNSGLSKDGAVETVR